MKLSLIGFMGAGKSTLARSLAQTLPLQCIELDELIRSQCGYPTIKELFDAKGEAAFRDLETQCLLSIADTPNIVISTGGGIIQRTQNLPALKSHGGLVIYLHAEFDTLHQRLKGDTTRPLFANLEKARQLYKTRLPLYQTAADITLITEDKTPQQLIADLHPHLLTSPPTTPSNLETQK